MGAAVEIPRHLLENWASWRLGDVEALAADVRARCAEAVRAWDLGSLTPLPGGEVALVMAARVASGEAVLKVSPRSPGAAPGHEAEALALWAGAGVAPALLGVRDGGHTLLLERVRPGLSLRDTGAGAQEILQTIGALCRRIHLRVEHHRLPTLAEHAREDGWFDALAGTPECAELQRLCASSAADRLLHVDLHWLNVLRGADGWLAIDPKGCVGDPCAEVWALFDGPPRTGIPCDPAAARAHVRRLVDVYARAAGLDPERVDAWVRIRALVTLAQADPAAIREPGLARLAARR